MCPYLDLCCKLLQLLRVAGLHLCWAAAAGNAELSMCNTVTLLSVKYTIMPAP
jgi:hypothetical protein